MAALRKTDTVVDNEPEDADGEGDTQRDEDSAPWGRMQSLNPSFEAFSLSGSEVFMGRNKECVEQARFTDKRISSKHCRIWKEGDEVSVEDLSANGTFVNGTLVGKGKTTALAAGDVLSLLAAQAPDIKKTPVSTVPAYVFVLIKKPAPAATKTDSATSDTVVDAPPKAAPAAAPKRDLVAEMAAAAKASAPKAAPVRDLVAEMAAGGVKRPAETDDSEGPERKKAKVEEPAGDDTIEENLMCGICQDLLYQCVVLMPCLHNFCAACYSGWKERSGDCPVCRERVEEIRKNHVLNNVVEAYLAAHPSKKRSEEEIKEMDAKNKLTADMLGKVRKKKRREDDYDDEEGYDEYDEEEEDYHPYVPPPIPMMLATPAHFPPPTFGILGRGIAPAARGCVQCVTPAADGFKCRPGQAHITCAVCLDPMPDRRTEAGITQRCELCLKIFCDLYVGCKGLGKGALKKLREWKCNELPPHYLNDNQVEQELFEKYLAKESLTVPNVFDECVKKLDDGVFDYTHDTSDVSIDMNGDNVVCKLCARNVFRDLVFKYREIVDKKKLPDGMGKRPDCHYGRECRTQKHNEGHARKYNHICGLTKKKS